RVAHVDADRVGAVARTDRREAARDQRHRLVPTDGREAAVRLAAQRSAHAVGIVMHVRDGHTLRADVAVREDVVLVSPYGDDPVALDLHLEATRGFAEGAGPVDRSAGGHAPPATTRHQWTEGRAGSSATGRSTAKRLAAHTRDTSAEAST